LIIPIFNSIVFITNTWVSYFKIWLVL